MRPGPEANQVELASFQYLHEAELAVGYLNDAGIAAVAIGDPAGQIQYGKGFSAQPRVLVREEDLDEARTLLVDLGVLSDSG
jgi:hypothetical protein